MSRTPVAWKRTWVCGTAALLAAGLSVSIAAADPSIAAPGDCAQPSRDLDTGPVVPSVSSSGGVAGPASSHFAPVDATHDVVARLTGDLTGIKLQIAPTTSAASTSLLGTIGATLGLVDSSTSAVGQTASDAIGDTVGALGNTGTAGETVGGITGAGAGGIVDSGATLDAVAGPGAALTQDAGSLIQGTAGTLTNTTGGLLP